MDRRELLIKELKHIDTYLAGIEQSIANINAEQEQEKEKENAYPDSTFPR